MEVKFPVLQGVDQTRNDREASCDVGLVRCPNFEIPVCLKFLGTFAECLSKAFTKLQLGFTLGGIAIGESLLADVVDGGDNLLEFCDSKRDLFEWSRLRSGSLLFRRARSSHGCVKKSLTEGQVPGKKTTGFDGLGRCEMRSDFDNAMNEM